MGIVWIHFTSSVLRSVETEITAVISTALYETDKPLYIAFNVKAFWKTIAQYRNKLRENLLKTYAEIGVQCEMYSVSKTKHLDFVVFSGSREQ
jgi:hypothetical protein